MPAFGEDVDLDIGPRTSNPTQQTTWEAGLTLIVTAWAISMSFVVRAVCLVAQHLERQLLVDRVPLPQDAFGPLRDRAAGESTLQGRGSPGRLVDTAAVREWARGTAHSTAGTVSKRGRNSERRT